jgi:hypothetical protein
MKVNFRSQEISRRQTVNSANCVVHAIEKGYDQAVIDSRMDALLLDWMMWASR